MVAMFLAEWASPHQYAAMYRGLGGQVVPARRGEKRPLEGWVEFQNALVPQAQFDRWYDPHTGEYRNLTQMGLLTGACSRLGRSPEETTGLSLIDSDVGGGKDGVSWWRAFIETHLNGIEPETWRAVSGGGGLHNWFLAPPDWTAPTTKFPEIGVDIRGQGGFGMVDPSMHPSGKPYQWVEGYEPWSIPIAFMPRELCDEIDRLRGEHRSSGPRIVTPPSPQTGLRQDDGRETKLLGMTWAAVVDLRRESPIPPNNDIQEREISRLWTQYELTTRSRLPDDGRSNGERLEAEGRGLTELRQKWSYAMLQWDGKVAEAAKVPKPDEPSPNTWGEGLSATLGKLEGAAPGGLFEVLSMADMASAPEMEWLIEDALPMGGLVLLFGAPGSFKTFVAVDLALRLTYDAGSWLGHDAKRGLSVLYIASEGSAGMYRRIIAWRRKHGLEGDSARFRMIRQPMSFVSGEDIGRLVATVQADAAAHGLPSIIFVDTVSRVLPGVDENLQKDMTVFIAGCDRLRAEFGAAVVGVHHTNKAGAMRGSSVLDGAADSIFRVERDERSQAGTLTCEKQKDAEDGWRAAFTVAEDEWIPAGRIKPVKSLVVDWREGPAPEEPADPADAWPPRAVLRSMQLYVQAQFDAGEPLSLAKQTRGSGRFAALRLANQFDVKIRVVAEVLDTWERNGVVEVAMASSHTKMRGLKVRKWID